jgi:PEP-CTERM motif
MFMGKVGSLFSALLELGVVMNAKVLAAFLLVATGALSTQASATLITYTETADVSGSLNGTAFTDILLSLEMTGDTSSITEPRPNIFTLVMPLDFTLSGGGSGVFSDAIQVVANQPNQLAGFGDNTDNEAVLFTSNPSFASYDLSTAIGPIVGGPAFNSGQSFPTSAGNLIIDSVSGDATFTATAGAVPEPSTWAMMALGFGLLGLVGYRKTRSDNALA